MNQPVGNRQSLLDKAKAENPSALGALLDQHRNELRRQAEEQIGHRLQARVDASDIVQQTCLSAVRAFGAFRGTTAAEFAAWLRRIHDQNIHNVIRDHTAAKKRALNREEQIDHPDRRAGQIRHPCEQTASAIAENRERRETVRLLLKQLPQDQQTAVRMRHLEGKALREIAETIGRSESAVIGLLKRGMQELRRRLNDGDAGSRG